MDGAQSVFVICKFNTSRNFLPTVPIFVDGFRLTPEGDKYNLMIIARVYRSMLNYILI